MPADRTAVTAFDKRVRRGLVRLGKASPPRLRRRIARAARPLRRDLSGPTVSVVLAVSDDETTRIGPLLESLRRQTHRNLDVVIVPYGRCRAVTALAREHCSADWRLSLRRTRRSRAEALDAGARAARGSALVFVRGGDLVLPRGVERLVAAQLASGSPLVVGRMMAPDQPGFQPLFPFGAAHSGTAIGTTLAASPQAVTDLGLGNRLISRRLWRSAGLHFTEALPGGEDVGLALYRQASSFDLLSAATYVPTGRRDGMGVDATPELTGRVERWIGECERLWHLVTAEDPDGSGPLVAWWLWAVLDTSVQPLLADVEHTDDAQWARLRDHVRTLSAAAGEGVLRRLSAESRVALWLAEQDRRAELARFTAARRFTRGDRPTVVRDGSVHAELPFHDDPDFGAPPDLFEMTEAETGLVARLVGVRWRGLEAIELSGTAAIDFVHLGHAPRIRCWLARPGSDARIELDVTGRRDHRANIGGRGHQDFSRGGFEVALRVDRLLADSGQSASWEVWLEIEYEGVSRSGRLTEVFARGSAAGLGSGLLAPRTIAGREIGFGSGPTGFGIDVRTAEGPQFARLETEGRRLSGEFVGTVPAELVFSQEDVRAAVRMAPGPRTFDVAIPRPAAGQHRWSCLAVMPDGSRREVRWPETAAQWLGTGGAVVAARTSAGDMELVEADGVLVVDGVARVEDGLELSGRWLGPAPDGPVAASLTGAGVSVPGEITLAADRCRIRFPLAAAAWGLAPRPLPYGDYRVWLEAAGGTRPAVLGEEAVGLVDEREVDASYALRVLGGNRWTGVELSAPLAPGELGRFGVTRLERWFVTAEVEIDERSVYLQSYAGASATDSQLQIHRELRRVRPDLTIHWGVAGPHSWTPRGGRPVVIGTAEWFRVLASARLSCLNIDPERWYVKRPGQSMVQTFHGYPAKSMGLRMWRAKNYTRSRIDQELARTSQNWDLILTPAPEMDRYYREEYAYDGPIHSAGYPRDDPLVCADAERVRADTRRRLGIAPDQRAILYAPTWRDDLASNWRAAELVRHLDLESVSRELGPGFVLLMRGHRFHRARTAAADDGTRLLDVTDYPEINDLIVAADAAVLDYSSLRFDFALTGRPMIFLVPDLDSYVGNVRGFLYDFRESAPGPLVTDAQEVVELLRDLDGLRRAWEQPLEAFNARYNYLQDGRSAERVVRAMLDLL